jgi:hypothetical protein
MSHQLHRTASTDVPPRYAKAEKSADACDFGKRSDVLSAKLVHPRPSHIALHDKQHHTAYPALLKATKEYTAPTNVPFILLMLTMIMMMIIMMIFMMMM